ncbi:MAG: RDD family protein [Actinomycetota bacterium]
MQYEDRLRIDTPEGVPMDITLAGVGSRIAAAALDGLVQGAIIIAVFLILALNAGDNFDESSPDSSLLIIFAISQVVIFIVLFFYYVILETLWSGRSIGKRALGLRVIDASGGAVGIRASVVRNILRIIDVLPFVYLIGTIAVVTSKRNQRLGDMVGGTLVVRDNARAAPASRFETDAAPEGWDVTGVTEADLAVVRGLLARWDEIAPGAKQRLADDLKDRLSKKIGGGDASLHAYDFLRQVIAETDSRKQR